VKRIDFAVLERVPFWLAQLVEAFGQADVRAIKVQTCDVCMEMPAPRNPTDVLAEFKRRIEGR
jgi:hypothetical protein